MAKFRKKPVVIEAMQYSADGSNQQVIIDWADKIAAEFDEDSPAWGHGRADLGMTILTREGEMTASPGDWIICGVAREFYPCKPDIFAATYEPVE